MPVIQGKNANYPTDEYTAWGLAKFEAGLTNVSDLHYHDCDEFIFMIEGRCVFLSEGISYTLGKGDVLVTRMGDEHQLVKILENTVYFWAETELKGQKRPGHLHR